MTSCIYISPAPPMVTEADLIPQDKLLIINLDLSNRKEKWRVSIPTLDGGRMQDYPHFLYANDWLSTNFAKPRGKEEKKKSKGKGKAKPTSCNFVSASSRKVDFDDVLCTNSEDEQEDEIVYSTQTEAPVVVATRSGNPYHKNYDELAVGPS